MPDTKITALAAITTVAPSNDLFPIVDVSDNSMAASGTTKNITVNQLLGAGGIAALSSATITGNLTVGTGSFGVGQSGGLIGNGNQLGFTNNSGSNSGWISNADNACIYSSGAGGAFAFNGHLVLQPRGSAAGAILFGTGNGAGAMAERYRIASDGVATWSNVGGGSGTAMTLNSTGLGVGVSPAFKLSAAGVSQFYAEADGIYASGNSAPDLYTIGVNYYNAAGTEGVKVPARPSWKIEHKNSNDALAYLDIGFRAASAAASAFTSRFKIDGTGNVGIGVTSPAFKLDVAGSSGSGIRFTGNSVSTVMGETGGFALLGTTTNHNLGLYTNGSVKATIDTSGNVGISSGNLVMSTSGKGIDFSATPSGSGTMTSELLNDYEEGTFVPTIVGTTLSGNGTYTTQLGRYTKVGRIVTCDISLVWTAHDGTGNIDIGGLPFSVLNTTGYAASAVIGYIDNIALTAGNIPIAVLWWFNTTKIRLNQTPTGGGTASGVPMDSAGQINLSITYIVA